MSHRWRLSHKYTHKLKFKWHSLKTGMAKAVPATLLVPAWTQPKIIGTPVKWLRTYNLNLLIAMHLCTLKTQQEEWIWRLAHLEIKATRASVLCTSCSVLEFCTISPFRRHRIPSLWGSIVKKVCLIPLYICTIYALYSAHMYIGMTFLQT